MAEAGSGSMADRGRKKTAGRKAAAAPAFRPVRYARMDTLRAHVIVHGLVQGVWFRASTKEEAIRMGVNGWVRNMPDGTVEALFEGEKKKEEERVGWWRKGA